LSALSKFQVEARLVAVQNKV